MNQFTEQIKDRFQQLYALDKTIFVGWSVALIVATAALAAVATILTIPRGECAEVRQSACIESGGLVAGQESSSIAKVDERSDTPLSMTPDKVCVEVAGAIKKPGVYCLDKSSRVIDAVERAGGFNTASYAYSYIGQKISMARNLVESEKIYIPYREDLECIPKKFAYVEVIKDSGNTGTADGSGGSDGSDGQDGGDDETCVNINTASKDRLMTLEGIGEVTAQKIIDARPYSKVEDLLNVSGIGEAKFETIKDALCEI